MRSEDNVVDHGLVDEVAHLDEARHGGHHTEDAHLGGVSARKRWTFENLHRNFI